MPTSKEYLEYILEQLRDIKYISYKPMMGEYLLYKNNVLFGGIYDNRLLVKKTKSSDNYELREVFPYPGAKSMYLIEEVENIELISEIIDGIIKNLSKGK
ncbi:MAG: competence protein TfoX [Erysipelotrichales bacterium]|nr:competence protein TfoX [Erysipelotrichales bacterium]